MASTNFSIREKILFMNHIHGNTQIQQNIETEKCDSCHDEQLRRIADGIEKLKNALAEETNESKKRYIFGLIAEALCS